MHQNAQICTLQFKNFPGAMPPNPHVGEGLRRPSPNPIFIGTPALCASRASLWASNLPNVCSAVDGLLIRRALKLSGVPKPGGVRKEALIVDACVALDLHVLCFKSSSASNWLKARSSRNGNKIITNAIHVHHQHSEDKRGLEFLSK